MNYVTLSFVFASRPHYMRTRASSGGHWRKHARAGEGGGARDRLRQLYRKMDSSEIR